MQALLQKHAKNVTVLEMLAIALLHNFNFKVHHRTP